MAENNNEVTYNLTEITHPDQDGCPSDYELKDPVSSVLDVAWDLCKNDRLGPWSSVLAPSQTKGRGRHGRAWASPPGHVYAALRLPLECPFEGTLAPMALSLGLVLAFRDLGCESVKIKWPNDLLVPQGKAGGILLENRLGAVMAGIGLNLGQSPFPAGLRDPAAPPPAAFPAELGPPSALWPKLANYIRILYNKKFPERDPDWARNICALAEKNLAGMDRPVTVRDPVAEPRTSDTVLAGRLLGLAPSGALLLDGPAGKTIVWSGTLILPNQD
ncbi:MAG: biotin--acetyl-CoA-carboxylase ligase [Deltaproteobacteria bacterium]|jgi:BirA family biotin operon repressor/biotin-[acetyl-CoA-carboxylase] ligase|nr:biotin--acetyl-CoA-carboxylase ligase [Deltaproteobacteria bacterium]